MRCLYISFFLCLVAGAVFSQTGTAAKKDSSGIPRIVIRCKTTDRDPQPLWIVDGVMVDTAYVRKINPNDIESLQILKDDSLAAVFSHRASNGLIIITTKIALLRQFVIKDLLEGDDVPGATLTFISLKNKKDSLRFVADEQGVVKTALLRPGGEYKVEVSSVGYKALSTTYKNTSSTTANQFLLERIVKENEGIKIISFGYSCRRTLCCIAKGVCVRSLSYVTDPAGAENLTTRVYPNPLTRGNAIKMEVNMQEEKVLQIRVANLNGLTLHSAAYRPFKGINRIEIPARSQWSAGMYFLQILDEKGKLLKQDKLLIQ